MVYSTNQVLQLFVTDGTGTAAVQSYGPSDRLRYIIEDGNATLHRSPIFDKILSVEYKAKANDVLNRKALKVTVDDSNVVKGQKYVITLIYHDFTSDEDTYLKFADAIAKDNGSAGNATLIQDLAKSFLVNQRTEVSPLYELRAVSDGSLVDTKTKAEALAATGFYVVEPVPDWVLGTFPERLLDIDVAQNTIEAGGLYVDSWIVPDTGDDTAKFKVYSISGVNPIKNSHRVQDLQYFAYGEKGNSAWLSGWPMNIVPSDALPYDANGYDVTVVHVARIGDNQNSSFQEMDLVYVGDGAKDVYDEVAAALNPE